MEVNLFFFVTHRLKSPLDNQWNHDSLAKFDFIDQLSFLLEQYNQSNMLDTFLVRRCIFGRKITPIPSIFFPSASIYLRSMNRSNLCVSDLANTVFMDLWYFVFLYLGSLFGISFFNSTSWGTWRSLLIIWLFSM